MEILTKTEERVMQILWDLKSGFVKDVIDRLGEPTPYNTISSLIRILEKKGFVDHKAYGKTHEYFPVISKAEYRKFTFQGFLSNYFEGAPENVISFMVKEENIAPDDIQKMLKMLGEDKNNS
ncbi:MAG TPA: BlaI/MecI/CopY family transcriptional regulator [Dyadobacter sp.]|jgi:predicted transcriptional regulator|nr:BlaI/MecI/CopY family transcriptional regulator [Dyadobacter sp.]